jgi:hypothetical protein
MSILSMIEADMTGAERLGGGGEMQQGQEKRTIYQAPKIHDYGSFRSLTLGGSPGTGDSGAVFIEEPMM